MKSESQHYDPMLDAYGYKYLAALNPDSVRRRSVGERIATFIRRLPGFVRFEQWAAPANFQLVDDKQMTLEKFQQIYGHPTSDSDEGVLRVFTPEPPQQDFSLYEQIHHPND